MKWERTVQKSYLTSEETCGYENRTRYFTVAEANRALVLVRRIVSDVVAQYNRMLDLHETLESSSTGRTPRHMELLRESLIASVNQLQHCQEELTAVGVDLRDWALGIADFPCLYDGRVVSLCWKLGEPEVAYWHELDEGFAGRRSVKLMLPARAAG